MRKLMAARRHLMQRLGIAADKLLTFAQDGTVISHRSGRNGHFGLRYQANFIVTDYAGPPADLFFAVLEWLHADNPGVVQDALQFHVDILDHRCCDIALRVEISEIVKAEATADGTWLRGAVDADAHGFDMSDLVPAGAAPAADPAP